MNKLSKITFFGIFFTSTIALAEYPQIKPGYWQITTIREAQPARVVETCLDKNTMEEIINMGQQVMGSSCSDMKMVKNGDVYNSNVDCNMGNIKISTVSAYEGNFQDSYTFNVETKFVPAMMGKTGSKSTGNGKFVGECPSGMKPGDTKMEDGKIINPKEMLDKMPKDFLKNMGEMMKKLPQMNGNVPK